MVRSSSLRPSPGFPLMLAALLVVAACIAPAQAQTAPDGTGSAAITAAPDVAELLRRLDEQDQRIRVLERRLEIAQEETRTAAASTPVVRAAPGGFSLQSRDGANQIRLRAVLHADSRQFLDNAAPDGSDTFLLRRVRPIIEGTLLNTFDYKFTPDFANGRTVIQDAYVVARFRPQFALTVGKFKTPFGLERLQSASDIRFAERALPNNLVPNRDLGVQVGGELLDGRLSYAVAWLNGVNDGGSSENNASPDLDNNDDKDIAIRLFGQPFRDSDHFALRGLGVGVAATYADSTGSASRTLLTTYRTPGQQTFFSYRTGATPTFADGRRFRWTAQGSYYNGSLGLLGEFVGESQDVSRTVGTALRSDTLVHCAWQLSAGWFLTGEDSGFKAPAPKRPYAKGGDGWGALELVARLSDLTLDAGSFTGGASSFADPAAAARRASAWSVGLNWYLTQSTKFVLDYEQTRFDGGAAAGADRPDEKVVFSRVQVAF